MFSDPQGGVSAQQASTQDEDVCEIPPTAPTVLDKKLMWNGSLGDERKLTLMRQVVALKPFKGCGDHGSLGKTWDKVAENISGTREFRGYDLQGRYLKDFVCEKLLKEFTKSNNKNKNKTGTDDEEVDEFVILCTDACSLRDGGLQLMQQRHADKAANKNADTAAGEALLHAAVAGMEGGQENARVSAKRNYDKMNDNEAQMQEPTGRVKDKSAATKRHSGGVEDQLAAILENRKQQSAAKLALKERQLALRESAARIAGEKWELEKAERQLKLELLRKGQQHAML
ncbi:hypothetical protein CYMTET_13441 [Cymbomonas tetramitiformis]|uniref:Uncharacterized protein n=1 Tax=Cymbomonas tetramitiformis TaxID=36881 RepID=A0AAE0GJM3_9CHLO|nr:hypothetical protein CYMTET_13441 [Cymbomonas tetramitiformis]